MGTPLRIHVCRTCSEVAALTPAWRALHANSDNPFLGPAWTGAWIDVGRETPFIVTAWRGETLAGVLPFVRRRRALGHSLEFVEGDAFGMLARADDRTEVAQAFAAALVAARSDWNVLIANEFLAEDPSVAALETALNAAGLVVDAVATSRYPFVTIEGPAADYERRVGKKVVNEVKRRQRQLAELGPLRFERATRPEDVARYFQPLVELHARRWRERSDTSAFSDPLRTVAMQEAARRIAEDGHLALDLLFLDEVLIAACYGFRVGGRLVYYSPAFDPAYAPYSVSKILLYWQLSSCFREGLREFDFARGEETYKSAWATGVRNGRTVVVHHAGGRVLAGAVQMRLRAVKWLKAKPEAVHFKRITVGRWRNRLRPSTWRGVVVGATGKLRRSIGDRGLLGTARFAGARATAPIHEHVHARLYRATLTNDPPSLPAGCTIEVLSPRCFNELAAGGRYDLATIARMHYQGQRCRIIRVDTVLAAYAWEARGRTLHVPELGEELRLQPDELYLSDCYTLAAYRGRGLYPLVLRHAMAAAACAGARTAYIVVDDDNTPSIRGIERAGFTLERSVDRAWWFSPEENTKSAALAASTGLAESGPQPRIEAQGSLHRGRA